MKNILKKWWFYIGIIILLIIIISVILITNHNKSKNDNQVNNKEIIMYNTSDEAINTFWNSYLNGDSEKVKSTIFDDSLEIMETWYNNISSSEEEYIINSSSDLKGSQLERFKKYYKNDFSEDIYNYELKQYAISLVSKTDWFDAYFYTINTGNGWKVFSYSTKLMNEDLKEECKEVKFEEFARNPNKHKGERVKLTGEVVQVMFDNNFVDLRVNITKEDGYYKDTVYVLYTMEEGEDKILEDDIITIYGTIAGDYQYTSTFGTSVSLPIISASTIDLNK